MKRIALFALLVVGAGCHRGPAPELVSQYQGRSAFTCCNIHYETDQINDANYFIGTTLPLGTSVTIHGVGRDSVTFVADGKTLTLSHSYGRDQESMQQYIDKVLVATDPKPRLAGFSHSAQDAIKEGRVERGMTREQVLLSLGYPPTHKTPSLDAREWTYWYNRWVSYKVAFDDGGKVSSVIGRPAPTNDKEVHDDPPPPAPAAKAPAKAKSKAKK
ncbi:MAG TPA: outer membrane protein assembly factor BamE [Candidatus Binatia bacterium]|nr:outer membrane protein assembly factor BamE [Candidatus Binatia bacterium]